MKPLIACLLLLLSVPAVMGGDPKAPPARVVMTGKVTLLIQSTNVKVSIQPGEDVGKKLAEALKSVTATRFDLADNTSIVVAFPPKTVTPNDFFNVKDKLVAVEGILTSTDDSVLVALGPKGAKQVPLLIAEKLIWVDDKNKAKLPAENQATIEGVADKAEIRLGSITVGWAIRNGDGRIPLLLAKDTSSPNAGSKMLTSGMVRVVEGQPVLEASKVESRKK